MDTLPELHPGRLSLVVAPRGDFPKVSSLIAALALRSPLRVLDGGNCFDAYAVAQTLRRCTPHVDAADVLLFDPHLQTLDYAAGRGFRTQAITRLHLRLGESHAGRAALERRTVAIPDVVKSGAIFIYAELMKNEGFAAYYGVPLIAKGNVKGVLEVMHRALLDPDADWLDFLETLAGQAAIAIDNASLFDGLQRSNAELILAYEATIEGWAKALELRDRETKGHTYRVLELTLQMVQAMGISEDQIPHIRRGTILHDIGKMAVPDGILLKPGPLTSEEWAIMRQHPQYAYDLIYPIPFLRPSLEIPYGHHEKWDGSGYPQGLHGEHIPLAARIFTVVDVWDALTSDRPYRRAWSVEKTLDYLQELAGKHFDPKVVEVFLRLQAK